MMYVYKSIFHIPKTVAVMPSYKVQNRLSLLFLCKCILLTKYTSYSKRENGGTNQLLSASPVVEN